MALITKPKFEAQKLLRDIGMDNIVDLPMDLLAAGLDATLVEEPLQFCEGRITFSPRRSLIKVNSAIEWPERKRFISAHEIGHHILHKNMELPPDTFKTVNIIAGFEKHLKTGKQELEANEFAGELLMPTAVFLSLVKAKPFTPLLLKEIATQFKTSLTATIFKYLECGLHPICLVMSENGKVKYFKRSENFKGWLEDRLRLPPPADSVAAEYINHNYDFIYKTDEKAQTVRKSVWFTLNSWEEDEEYYEYCIPTKRYKTVLSVLWRK
jgi:Zn-dependent peptidase ImmA (M78 family)